MLRFSGEMLEDFRVHFLDCFVRLSDVPLQEFRRYLADFPRLQEAEVDACEGLVTECEVCDALKEVSLNKLPGLDGLSYEAYLKMSQIFVPILTNVFSHWFAQ